MNSQEIDKKCPKVFFGLITKHTWVETETRLGLALGRFDVLGLFVSEACFGRSYTNFRICTVCGEVQGYYQGMASAGWEPLGLSASQRQEFLKIYFSSLKETASL